MKKLSAKQKAWHISNSKHIMRLISKRNKHKIRTSKNKGKSKGKSITPYNGHRLSAPARLSLVENQEETLAFFELAINTIRKSSTHQHIYFNLENVEFITTDAIMYIIALVKNVRRVNLFSIVCEGNVPRNAEARTLIEQAGFYSYVSGPPHIKVETDKERIQISCGHNADGDLAGRICDFVMRVSKKDRQATKRLFPLIMELMTNTKQHAYKDENQMMFENWYIFVEDMEDCVSFVFLDTGAGIPSTIRKGLTERFAFWSMNDASFIASALKGQNRTETKQSYRGKGLPEIYNYSCAGQISDLVIISGKGKCKVENDGSISESSLKTAFVGTLFCWRFMK